ncbi:MAG: tetratricopeptide repeat protein [Verrucomicrobiales bacterium]|nr:tetratricopeptide repeat protein [Verrucomicrobiales bacterium]
MQPEVSQSDGMLRFEAWVHANRNLIITGVGMVAAGGLMIYGYVSYQEGSETKAAEALTNVQPVRPRENPPAGELAAGYLKVAADHPGTVAGRQAVLRAASALFGDGKYAEAQAQFEKFLSNSSGSPFASQAAFGVAACLDAQGKTTEALAKYDEVAKRYSTEGVAEDAKLSMAKLYVAQNKPELAYKLFEEITQGSRGGTAGQEAFMKREELAQKFPYLRSNTPSLTTPTTILGTNAAKAVDAVKKSLTNIVAGATNAAASSGAPATPAAKP